MIIIKCASCKKEVEKTHVVMKFCKKCAKDRQLKRSRDWHRTHQDWVKRYQKDHRKQQREANERRHAKVRKLYGIRWYGTFLTLRRNLQIQFLADRLGNTDYWIQSSKKYAENQLKQRYQNEIDNERKH